MAKKIDSTLHFRGKTIFGNDKFELLKFLENHLKTRKTTFSVFTPNPEQLVLAEHDESFNQVLKSADLLIPDGMGLVWASRILTSDENQKIKERIAGRAVVTDLLQISKNKNLSVLVIGGRNYSKTGKLEINGLEIDWLKGYANVAQKKEAEEKIIQKKIKELKPKMVFVAFGAPEQEKWINEHKELLKKSDVRLVMAVGGSFDYLLGKVPTPPAIVGNLGLEWLFRLIFQPWRWRRQLRLIEFVGLIANMKLNKTN
jgi:N-acetylglucosaminyldiphosphoundecaprenol N-acetyl-beta-D-mannosaminyltransferase